MIARAFKIKCLTNMHVGKSDVNFNIIDNEVERDAVSNYPTINSSGVKGALREYFEAKLGDGAPFVIDVFGAERSGVSGRLKFLSANMISIPMRASGGDAPYHMVTTNIAVNSYNQLCESLLGSTYIALNTEPNGKKAEVEGNICDMTNGLAPLGIECAAVMDDEGFGAPDLPVVARNRLVNGMSRTLWYEEIVAHESVFFFIVIANDSDAELLEEFTSAVVAEPIQFGGNSTIGYGLCSLSVIGG